MAPVAIVGALTILVASPVAAECTGQPNRWLAFVDVAPSAQRIVVGTVGSDLHGYEISPWFDLQVTEVLRGDAPSSMEIRRLVSGLPLTGAPACRDDAVLYARAGDVIALALDGHLPGEPGRINTAAWIDGRLPPGILVNGVERLTLAEVRQAAHLPDTATLAPLAPAESRALSFWLAALVGVAAAVVLVGFRRRRQAQAGVD